MMSTQTNLDNGSRTSKITGSPIGGAGDEVIEALARLKTVSTHLMVLLIAGLAE